MEGFARRLVTLVLVPFACGPDVTPGGDGTSGATDVDASTTADTGVPESSGTVDDTGPPPPSTPVEAHIEAWCQAWLSATCPFPRYASLEECIDHYTMQLQPWIDIAPITGLELDEQCCDDKVAALLGEPSCSAEECPLFVGTAGLDEFCEPLADGLASQCAAGAVCFSSRCVPLCLVIPDGGDCGAFVPGDCEESSQCVFPGDACDIEGTCERVPWAGETCESIPYIQCSPGLWCDGGICNDQYGGVGDSCMSTLNQPCDDASAYCEMDVCTALLPDGAPCTIWASCASGACVGDLCVPLPATVGAPCHQEYKCGGGLECDAWMRTCREPFTSAACDWHAWCPFDPSSNDVCDEGDGPDQCPPGTDAADCGYCPDARQGDGVCDEPNDCAPGTDPDC
jgi:hypothetical protein